MKTLFIAVLSLTTTLAFAQTDPAKAPVTNKVEIVAPPTGSVSIRTMQSLEQTKPVPPKPNEIKTEKGVYSGVLPQVKKTDNPLQLINPAAPKEYGDAKDNTVIDPRTGQGQGIKLFSFSWFSSDPNKPKVKKVKAPAAAKTEKTK
jgi:hypothetical protein